MCSCPTPFGGGISVLVGKERARGWQGAGRRRCVCACSPAMPLQQLTCYVCQQRPLASSTSTDVALHEQTSQLYGIPWSLLESPHDSWNMFNVLVLLSYPDAVTCDPLPPPLPRFILLRTFSVDVTTVRPHSGCQRTRASSSPSRTPAKKPRKGLRNRNRFRQLTA